MSTKCNRLGLSMLLYMALLCAVACASQPITVKQAVIAAGGWGTRFMPFSKSVPKEMVPLVDRPAIHYTVEECVASGIEHVIFVMSDGKEPIEHYFSRGTRADKALAQMGKSAFLQSIDDLLAAARFSFEYQDIGGIRGNGYGVWGAHKLVTNDYLAVLWPDDLLVSDEEPCLQQLIRVAQKYDGAVLALMEVPLDEVSAYGVVRISEDLGNGVVRIGGMVEKPQPHEAPSNIISYGRFIMPHRIFDHLQHLKPGLGGELQFTDAILKLIEEGFPVFGYRVRAKRFDLGNPAGWIKANNYLVSRDVRYAGTLN